LIVKRVEARRAAEPKQKSAGRKRGGPLSHLAVPARRRGVRKKNVGRFWQNGEFL